MPKFIQSLWIGPALSPLEQLSIRSFLAHGHEFHLYLYDQVAGVPSGTTLKNANEVLPRSMQFLYRDHSSYAGFANFFRYRLLLDKGGWWVDLDTVCLRRFESSSEYVFSSEEHPDGSSKVNVGVVKAPPGSPAMDYAWKQCQQMDVGHLGWGVCGPDLMASAVEQCSLGDYVRAPQVFCPLPWWEWRKAHDPAAVCEMAEETWAIHLWNEMWRRAGADKSALYDSGCLYEQLKQRYPVNGEVRPRRSWLGWSPLWGRLKVAGRSNGRVTRPVAATGAQESVPGGVRVSAVVLTRNGAPRIARCLQSILASNFADEIVVCIDRETTDNTYEIVRTLADRVHFLPTQGYIESVLPRMAALCSGEFILRIDDDERLGGNWSRDSFESLVALNDLTHLTIVRRWLVGDGKSFIASEPWFPDLQVRLFRNLPDIIVWPEQIHDPMVVSGRGMSMVDRWIEHDVLFATTREEREQKCSKYQTLCPGKHLSHFYLHEDRAVSLLAADDDGFLAAVKQFSAERLRRSLVSPSFPSYTPGTDIRFEAGQNSTKYVHSGWSEPEAWGTWTDARTAVLQLCQLEESAGSMRLTVEARAFLCARLLAQTVRVECGGEVLGRWTFTSSDFQEYSFTIPAELMNRNQLLRLTFYMENPSSPAQCGVSDDHRLLGIGVRSLRLDPHFPDAHAMDEVSRPTATSCDDVPCVSGIALPQG